jgi:galactokinase
MTLDHETTGRLRRQFAECFGDNDGLSCSRAPGRVNLIGEHTDYNGGFVLPMAVDRYVRIMFRAAERGPVRLWSENYGEWDEFDLAGVSRNDAQPWTNYVRGVAHILQEAGHALRPVEGVIHGEVPVGAGLSSSAALEVAAARAFCHAAGIEPEPMELALMCQRAERLFVGVACGIMDQFVILHARRGHALLLDCRSLAHELLPLDDSAVAVVVCNTMVHHELSSSAYNQRRARCEKAACMLADRTGRRIEMLRDVTPEDLADSAGQLDTITLKRARHVVGEIDRTERAALALKARDYEQFGVLMNESHDSLRDDYEVSCEELDLMVTIARRQSGTLGARMVGAGFGGCTVNLVRAGNADAVMAAVREGYHTRTGIEPEIYRFGAVDGARVLSC